MTPSKAALKRGSWMKILWCAFAITIHQLQTSAAMSVYCQLKFPNKKDEGNDAMASAFIHNVTDYLSSSAKGFDQKNEEFCNFLQYFLMRHAALFEGYDSEIFCGGCKYDVKDVISSYGQETLILPSNGVKDCGVLATLPETVALSRHKFPQISTMTLFIEEELEECCVIVILLLVVASEAKNWTATCDPVADRYSIEEIAASQTPPLLPALTAPFLYPITDSCDTCLKVAAAAERPMNVKQTFVKKILYCLGVNDHDGLGGATAFLDVPYSGDSDQFVLLSTVEVRDTKKTKFPRKMFWRKSLPFLLVSIAFVVLVRTYLQMEITEWLFWTHVHKQVQSPWPHSDMARSLQNVSNRSALQPVKEEVKSVHLTQNKTKRYIPEEREHPPSSKEHHLPFGKECEASLDSAYFSLTRDDSNTHSNSSEIPDDLNHGYEGAAQVIANDVELGIQETDYSPNDTYTAWQLKAVDRSTLVLDRNAPQPPKPILLDISCSDVSEEMSNQCQVKMDNLSTRYSRSPHPSVFNSSQTVYDAPHSPRQHKPSGKTMISGHKVVTGHQQPVFDANQDEDTTTLNDQLATGNIGEQTTSAEDYTQEDHRPDPSFTSVFIALPGPLGIVCVLDIYDINVSESHE